MTTVIWGLSVSSSQLEMSPDGQLVGSLSYRKPRNALRSGAIPATRSRFAADGRLNRYGNVLSPATGGSGRPD